jgi:phosphoribosylanthranilate isomerase
MRIKICGITTPGDAVLAAKLGADAVGLNFYPNSPRFISEAVARQIVRRLPAFVEPVALFVNEPPATVLAWGRSFSLIRTFQVHGNPTETFSQDAFQFIPAFPVADEADLTRIDLYLALCKAQGTLPPAVMVDARVHGVHGGTGQTAPWEMLAQWRPATPLILAGGLTPDNVAEAIKLVWPYAVDVASGVESSPGHKDEEKMRRFINRARATASKAGI